MKKPVPAIWDKFLSPFALFILEILEFSLAAWLTLGSAPDPKNAILFGYSLSRLALFLVTCAPALFFLLCAGLPAFGARLIRIVENHLIKRSLAWSFAAFSLLLVAAIVGLLPLEMLGSYALYFERVRPFLFVVCILPAQFSLLWIKKFPWSFDRSLLRQGLIALLLLLTIAALILSSGLGITPEQAHWNVAGTPLTGLQLAGILLTASLVLSILGLIAKKWLPVGQFLDLFIIFALFAAACLIWLKTPAHPTEFSTQPAAPYFQSYPASDAAAHDTGALSILKGFGIYFRAYTDKPLYMVFLALLHLVAGYNYNLLAILQACFMALMAPILYVFGKAFHSRFFGFVLAGLIVIRQQNAISLTNFLNFGANPLQFLTEVPTLLGMIIFTWALFAWLRSVDRQFWFAFVTGGILGALSLIRLNPFLLIPAAPVFLFFASGGRRAHWLRQSAIFLLGCAVLIAPWVVTGTNPSGQPYFLIKFLDIINVRYGSGGSFAPEDSTGFVAKVSPAQPSRADLFSPLSAGPSLPMVDIQKFPGFVINHTLHNFVGSLLTLPDSWRVEDQSLAGLMQRPYWKEGREMLALFQVPFILLNLVLLAFGLAWSWKRWKWAGLAPLFVFVVYSLSLGFGRTSGSRYLVPLDWLVDFYFGLGLLCVFQGLPGELLRLLGADPGVDEIPHSPTSGQFSPWVRIGIPALVVALALLIPAAQTLIPPRNIFCQPVDPGAIGANMPEGASFLRGELIYPELNHDRFGFSLLTCRDVISFEAAGFKGRLQGGQQILIGVVPQDNTTRLVLIGLPASGASGAQILWQAASK